MPDLSAQSYPALTIPLAVSGADSVDNVTAQDVIGNKLDTVAGDSLYAGLLRLAGAGGYGQQIARDTQTFANTAGAPVLFAVTGDVLVSLVAICKVVCASAGACNGSVGIAGATAAIIADTDITLIAANEIWHDAAPDALIEAQTVMKNFIISGGSDIILTLSAQADSGQIDFFCFWTPLSAGATVV